MFFEIDKQSFADLNILPSANGGNSIFNLFDRAATIGGKEKLEQYFKQPLTSAELINNRIALIKFFQTYGAAPQFDKEACDFAEYYLKHRSKPMAFFKITALIERMIYAVNKNHNYYVIEQGIINTIGIINALKKFIQSLDGKNLPAMLQGYADTVSLIIENEKFTGIRPLLHKDSIGAWDMAKADYIFRHEATEEIKTLLSIVYELDVFVSVAKTGSILGFGLPAVDIKHVTLLEIKNIFHPLVNNPITNNIDFSGQKNVFFVTGTNMAGKSTLLKSIGICIYLSQLGFPVPASSMQTSLFNGLVTTINLADNIFEGNSHFFNEVLRVKHAALKLSEKQQMFVIFDELFRGTNVKDAYDASLAIISAFAKVKNSFFLVSTHIVEVAKDLRQNENIEFKYMETVFDKEVPRYTYFLKEGITEERLGMWIVKSEGIVELIEKAISKK